MRRHEKEEKFKQEKERERKRKRRVDVTHSNDRRERQKETKRQNNSKVSEQPPANNLTRTHKDEKAHIYKCPHQYKQLNSDLKLN